MLVALAALALWSCGSGSTARPPAGVPSDAVWVGGPDGGVWASVRHSGESEAEVSAEIYTEGGEPLYRGRLRLEPPEPALGRLDDAELYSAWDGEKLHLRDGRALEVAGGR
ncbi:MAG: hypothetical protein R2762_14740 [Bryobacteraceae bacterium]